MVTSLFNICLYFNSILKETLKIHHFFPLMGFFVLFKNHIKIPIIQKISTVYHKQLSK